MKFDRLFYLKISNAAISTAIFAFLAIIVLFIFTFNEKRDYKNVARITLNAISDSKSKLVSDWYLDEIQDAKLISENTTFRDLIFSYRSNGSNYHLLIKLLDQIGIEHVYSDIVILSMDGEHIASKNAGFAFDDPSEIKYFHTARTSGNFYVSDIYRSIHDNEQYIDFITFIKDDNARNLACMIIKKDPAPFLNNIIAAWPLDHKTAETFVVKFNNEGKLLKYLDSDFIADCWAPYDSSGFNNKKVYSLNSGFVDDGITGGKVVFSYGTVIPGTPWGILVQADKKEMLSSLYSKVFVTIIILIAICILYFVLIFILIHLKLEKINIETFQNYSALNSYKEHFNLIMDMLDEGVIITDNDGFVKYINLKAETLTGWKFSEGLGKKIDEVFKLKYEDTGFEAFSFNNWLWEESGLTTIRNVVLDKRNDQSIPVRCTVTPVKSGLQGKSGVIVSFIDELDKQYKNKQIIESEKRFKDFFQDAPDATIIIDREGVIRLANMQALMIFRYTMNEFIGMKFEDIVPTPFFKHEEFLKKYFEEPAKMSIGSNNKINALRKNGSQFPIVFSLSPINYNNQQMAMVIVRDTTGVMQNEETLQLIGSIIGNIREGVILFKTKGRKIVFSNLRLNEIFGYSEGELSGKDLSVLFPDDEFKEELADEIISTLEENKAFERDILYARKDGSQIWIDTNVYSFFNETYGQVWVGVFKTISDKKVVEKENRLQKDRFNRIVSKMD